MNSGPTAFKDRQNCRVPSCNFIEADYLKFNLHDSVSI